MTRARRTTRNARHALLAFSLIEVLIAVVVLALGMLGLGAVIPVVVREQRIATDRVYGVSVENAAESFLLGKIRQNPAPFIAWRDDTANDGLLSTQGSGALEYRWMAPGYEPITDSLRSANNSKGAGDISLEAWTTNPTPDRIIRVEERLFPEPFTGGPDSHDQFEPRYVWDFVARPVVALNTGRLNTTGQAEYEPTGAVQFAVFVRKVDAGIRVPRNQPDLRVSNIITPVGDQQPSDDWRPAISVYESGGPQRQGLPAPISTQNMDVEYSAPIIVPVKTGVRFNPNASNTADRPSRIQLDPNPGNMPQPPSGNVLPQTEEAIFRLASQPGQKLVDSLGNIYTVLEVDDSELYTVVVEPEVPATVRDSDELIALAFVPETPISVSLITVNLP